MVLHDTMTPESFLCPGVELEPFPFVWWFCSAALVTLLCSRALSEIELNVGIGMNSLVLRPWTPVNLQEGRAGCF